MIQPDRIIRSRRKTLSISVDVFGQLTVRAPLRCDEERIFAFLKEKENWILKQKSKMKGAGICLPPDNLDGYRFLLLGKNCVLRLYEGQKIRYDETSRMIHLPSERAEERLVAWLKRNARRIFTAIADRRASEMQTAYPSLSVTSAKTRWGSCSYNNALHFSFRLLYAPIEVIDYVVVHELAHTYHKNHSKSFWDTVEKFVPDYKKKREWLKDKSALMEIF